MAKYVTFSGGFHNCEAIRIRVSEENYNGLKEGFNPMEDYLSESQIKRLRRHFCGVQGCMCGSYHRAELTF